MGEFKAIFQKVNGKERLREFAQGHVLLFALTQTALSGFSRKSLEIVRLSAYNKLLCKLRKKYRKDIAAYLETAQALPRNHSNKVWVCWLQGLETAPEIVRRCYRSLTEHLADREIILLTEENYRDYVTFPEHIQKKIDSGVITKTHMSDLLRLELLIRYGGTWIDATVFCSGKNIPSYMLDSDLFLFQTLKPGLDGHCTCMASWFMTACTNHPLLLLTRHLLNLYWQTHNALVDYFLIFDFFQLATEAYPEEWHRVIPFNDSSPHILLLRLFEEYNAELYQAVCQQTPFHKLSYKFSDEDSSLPGTYYAHILHSGTAC